MHGEGKNCMCVWDRETTFASLRRQRDSKIKGYREHSEEQRVRDRDSQTEKCTYWIDLITINDVFWLKSMLTNMETYAAERAVCKWIEKHIL